MLQQHFDHTMQADTNARYRHTQTEKCRGYIVQGEIWRIQPPPWRTDHKQKAKKQAQFVQLASNFTSNTAAQRKQGSGVWERVFCGGADVSEHLFSSAVQPAGLLGDQLDVILAQRRVRLGLCYQVVVLHDKVQGYGLEVGQAVVES